MNFKTIAAAGLLACSAFSAAAATATPTVTPLGTLDYTTSDDYPTTWSALATTYTDVYSFSLDEQEVVTGSAQVVSANHTQYWLTNNGTATLSLYEGVYSVGTSLSSYTLEDTVSFGTAGSTLDDLLQSGDYFYVITGTTAGTKGAKYDFNVTSVPEPANAALLLAGLGLFGVVAKRRKLR